MRHRLIYALASAALLAACGGGGGDGSSGGGNPAPSQPGESVPGSAMESVTNFMRFMAAWAADDTVEPLLINDQEPPTDPGDAWPVS